MDEVFIYWAILHCAVAALIWVVLFAFSLHGRLKRIEAKMDLVIKQSARCRQCQADSAVVIDDEPLCLYHAELRVSRLIKKKAAAPYSTANN